VDLNERKAWTSGSRFWPQRELSESAGKRVALQAAVVDVLTSASLLRLPIVMEYEDLRKLQINATTDPLTGLYNRRFFDDYFEKELNRSLRYSHHLALVVFDLHRFKEVNDRYGIRKGISCFKWQPQLSENPCVLQTTHSGLVVTNSRFCSRNRYGQAESAARDARRRVRRRRIGRAQTTAHVIAACSVPDCGSKSANSSPPSGMRSLKYAWIFGELRLPFEARYPLADVHSDRSLP